MFCRNSVSVVFLGMVCLLLAACASSDLATVEPVSRGQMSTVRVTKVQVAIKTPRPNPQLKSALTRELTAQLATCARGTTPHVARVVINEFEEKNVAMSIVTGDDIELGGIVRFTNVASGAPAGEYYVKESFFWGGLEGAAIMSNAIKNLSRDFAKSVCNNVLKDRAVLAEPEPIWSFQ